MKYRDLIQFEPIESVIELTEADNIKKAEELVRTFVVSESMEISLSKIIIPNLQFHTPNDQKGMFVVGNYGTGKSHLMAFISAIAENSDFLDLVNNEVVKEEAKKIAGKFKVIRAELGGVSSTLRNAICLELEKNLKKLGIEYKFPSTDDISNNKDSIHEMMSLFQDKYPDQGFVLILDELLDFLRGREDDQKLMQDLGFLREIGEVCKNTKFRFMTGVQESLFESPEFKFAADSLSRVSERFVQATILKEDVSFVVSRRLLKKTDEQKAYIRDHLTQFQSLYKPLSGALENFVDLFPVHEQYFEKFQMVNIGEQRKILESISNKIESIIDDDVPENNPGTFSYDSYWNVIKDDHTNRVNPNVKQVIKIYETVENILLESLPVKDEHKKVALRIISALSIHRLTTGDLKAGVGLTSENLKDELFLIMRTPEQNEDFLLKMIESIISKIMTTLHSLYIRLNEENRHYYFYADEGVDPSQEVKDKATRISDSELTRYYFDLLRVMMEQIDTPTIHSKAKIWEYQLMWFQKKVEMEGYLFFGSPNERSTAQPARDFYIYFLDPFKPSGSVVSGKDDEVFFVLKEKDTVFEDNLRSYAASKDLSLSSVQKYKTVYNQIGEEYKRKVVSWLKEHLATNFQVSYKNSNKLFSSWSTGMNLRELSGISGSELLTFKQQIDTLASGLYTDYFDIQKPGYPTFTIKVTKGNRSQTCFEAVKGIVKGKPTGQASSILTSLDLMSVDGEVNVENSIICKKIIDFINTKENGQVVNRNELFITHNQRDYIIDSKLEFDFLPIFLTALVNEGIIEITIGSDKVTAANIDVLTTLSFEKIKDFSHIKKSTDFPLVELKDLFKTLGLRPGLIVQQATRDDAIKQMIDKVDQYIKNCNMVEQSVRSGFYIGQIRVLNEATTKDILGNINSLRNYLEKIQRYNTPARIANLKMTLDDIEDMRIKSKTLTEVQNIRRFEETFSKITIYLERAVSDINLDTPWKERYRATISKFKDMVAHSRPWNDNNDIDKLKKEMYDLKEEYKTDYFETHKHYRLGAKGSDKKVKLQSDIRLITLNKLSTIDILPMSKLHNWREDLDSLRNCTLLTLDELEQTPFCSHCNFDRKSLSENKISANEQIEQLDSTLDDLLNEWSNTLRDNLEDPTIQINLSLISNKESVDIIRSFIGGADLPDDINSSTISSIKDLLQGLEKISITRESLLTALGNTGLPITPSELRDRFEQFLSSEIAGKDEKQTRIVLED